MSWTWDEDKDRTNIAKHKVSFETAILALDDPLSLMYDDPYPFEQRFRTIGMAGNILLLVVHTSPEPDPNFNDEVGRIISARRANAHERRTYENC